jgi:hypothetical protein
MDNSTGTSKSDTFDPIFMLHDDRFDVRAREAISVLDGFCSQNAFEQAFLLQDDRFDVRAYINLSS